MRRCAASLLFGMGLSVTQTVVKTMILCWGLFFISCSPDFDGPVAPQENILCVLTSDWTGSASYSVIDLDTLQCYNDLGAGMVHTDSVVRADSSRVFVLNRRGREICRFRSVFGVCPGQRNVPAPGVSA
jgi:hypothetical protein